MTGFEDSYRRWRGAAFPSGSTDDTIDELHAQLAQVDAYVADDVVPIANGKSRRPGAVNVLEELAELRSRIRQLAVNADAVRRGKLEQYDEYCGLLQDVYVKALQRDSVNQP